MNLCFVKVDEFSPYDKTTFPGCSVAIFHKDQILCRRGYGLDNLECTIPHQLLETPRHATNESLPNQLISSLHTD